MTTPSVLVIAGSDSSGGAGLEADQKVLAAHGCYAMTATTALTAQNTLGVEDIHVTPPEFVAKQINMCLSDIKAHVIKIGMLASAETVRSVARTLKVQNVQPIVLDPVMVATSGAQLLPGDAVRVLRELLLPMTTIVTPNVPEATLLLRDADVQYKSPENLDELKDLARMVHELGPKAVLLKGGHMPLTKDYRKSRSKGDRALIVDVLYDGTDYTLIESEYLSSKNTHGTGCSLASAIAANMASGQSIPSAVSSACRYVEAGIKNSRDLGKGNGPINHFHSLQRLPFAPGRFIEYLLGRQDVKDIWQAYTQHSFVKQIGNGTLPRDVFKHYMIQDYLYLTHFARAHALAAYKSKSMDIIVASAQIIVHIDHEMKLPVEYCKDFGLSKTEIEKEKESLACVAYSRWVLDIGHSEDYVALQMSLASCLLGYGVAAQKLTSDPNTKREGNPCWKWVENYVAEDYQDAVKMGSDLIEKLVQKQSPSRIEELVQIFIRATEMEIQFWEMDAHAPVSQLL